MRRYFWVICVVLSIFFIQPYLCFVDFLSFSQRAGRIWSGVDLLHPLYPIGYPALLSPFSGMYQLYWAKAISLVSGFGLLYFLRTRGHGEGWFLLLGGAFLPFVVQEGTDMPAAALTIIALLSAKKSPKLSACTLGLACLLRYTAWLAVPFALWESRQRWKYFALFALVTLPHWGMVIFSGGEFWNQGENALLGMNISYFHKFWEGLFFVGNPILLASFLCWGGRYRSLLLYGLLHFVIICYFFPNPRLLLPTSLVLAFCAGLVVEKNNKGWIWAVVVLSALLIHRNPTDRVWKERAQLAEKIEMVEGAFFSIAPHVYSIQEDKYVGATPLQILGDPQKMTYSLVLAQGQKRGVKWLVFPNQIRMAYPLLDLSSMTPVWSGSRWRVYKLDAD